MPAPPPLAPDPAARPRQPVPPGRSRGRRSAREQLGLAVLAVERAGRGALAHVRRSRLLRWRYRAPAADELLLAPPDLRAADTSFADELAAGGLGLAGAVARLDGRSPFAVTPPSPAWQRALDGFDWLRHLEAAGTEEARTIARDLVAQWLRTSRRRASAWTPDVTGRRILSWLSHAGLLLQGTEPRRYRAILRSLADQITYLATSWRNAPDGYPRLLALVALATADLAIAGHDRRLAQSERLLAAELERQLSPGGGQLGRNPELMLTLLLDLLPLRQCFAVRGVGPAPWLTQAVARLTTLLRHLRLGDGTLARFNGMGAGERDVLATVLAYDPGGAADPGPALHAGYARLERGSTVAIVDAGAVPALELAGAACAGCLSLELSSGPDLVLVNAGMPGPGAAASRALARATASHNTLCLDERSSSKLVRNARLESAIGGVPLSQPDNVACSLREEQGGAAVLEASHDGYVEALGLVHARTLVLAPDGTRLEGRDTLAAAKGVLRFAWDVPFAIHFHLHPDVDARPGEEAGSADLLLASGERWRLEAAGAVVSIEDSVHLAAPGGPLRASQIVLRGRCYGAAEVSWTLLRTRAGEPGARRLRAAARASLVDRLAETGAGYSNA